MDRPLVSVIVTTYNSAQFLVETLESIKAQTYQNIEVVVSDDASTDDSVTIAQSWIAKNSDRFQRTDIVTVPQNTGVSANCNRCIAAAKSDWIKFIAGDDILLPNCIEDNIRFVQEQPQASIIFSQVEAFQNTFESKNYLRTIPHKVPEYIMHKDFTAADQFKRLLISDRINFTPSYFFRREVLLNVGGYDEQNRWVEDYPMWLKLTRAGYKLYFFQTATVGYRQHSSALNNQNVQRLVKPAQLKSYSFRKKFTHPFLPWDIVFSERFTMTIAFLFDLLGCNRSTPILRICFSLFGIYLNPFRYVSFIKKNLLKVDPVFYPKA